MPPTKLVCLGTWNLKSMSLSFAISPMTNTSTSFSVEYSVSASFEILIWCPTPKYLRSPSACTNSAPLDRGKIPTHVVVVAVDAFHHNRQHLSDDIHCVIYERLRGNLLGLVRFGVGHRVIELV